MDPPLPAIVVCEPNRTRADLYSLWLEPHEVRVALTSGEAEEALDDEVGVGIVNQSFADGEVEAVLETLHSRSPMARVIATRDRDRLFPDLPVDHQLRKPVFEDELVEMVDTLIRRANFHLALKAHYQVAIALTSYRLNDSGVGFDEEDYETLEERANDLESLIAEVTREMDRADVEAVRESISFEGSFVPDRESESFDSKYLPQQCSQCGLDWSGNAGDEDPVVKLGAHVWRCTGCGEVHMLAGPGNNQIGSYRR